MPVITGSNRNNINILVVEYIAQVLHRFHFRIIFGPIVVRPLLTDIHIRVAKRAHPNIVQVHITINMAFATAINTQNRNIDTIVCTKNLCRDDRWQGQCNSGKCCVFNKLPPVNLIFFFHSLFDLYGIKVNCCKFRHTRTTLCLTQRFSFGVLS